VISDVVETVTFETETSLKLRDRDFIKNSETDTRLETSKFVDFAEFFKKMSSPSPFLRSYFFKFLEFFPPVFVVSYLQMQQRKTRWITEFYSAISLRYSNSRPVVPNLFWCISPFAHFGTFHSSPVRFRRLVLTTIGTMVFIYGNNLI